MAKAHAQIAISMVGILAIGFLLFYLKKLLSPNKQPGRRGRGVRSGSEPEFFSGSERNASYRRKAGLQIGIGLPIIAIGIFLNLFGIGIFSNDEDQMILGLFLFLPGYCLAIRGCSWWVKAKGWHDALVLIGLSPLAILFVPFVRLVFLRNHLLLPGSLLLMTVILIVVIFALPDKTGRPRKRRFRTRD